MLRPIHWLGPGHHDVNHYIAIGRQSVQAGLNHLALVCGTADTPDVSVYNVCRPNYFLWRELEPGSALPWAPLRWDLNYLFQLDPSSLPVAFMTSNDLVNWWSQLLKADPVSNKDFAAGLVRPEFLINFGFHKMHQDFCWESEEVSELAACLSMVGVGAVEILLADTCDLCRLRRAAPASKRCEQCSRSKQLTDEGGQRAQAAKSMRNKRIQVRNGDPFPSVTDELHASFSRSIASLLFAIGREKVLHQQWLEAAKSSLDVAPLVREKLQSNFLEISHKEQLAALRNVIDPNEWDYAAWPNKILRAQAFAEASDALFRRRRTGGPLPQTIDLANRARTLISHGLSMSEVALRLSISKSHLSHTLKRTSNFDK